MKFSAQEEYGLRCLLSLGKEFPRNKGLTIPEISHNEGITQHNVAKLLRKLRIEGFVASERGQAGGYTLTRSPEKILIRDVLNAMGGRLFDDSFCNDHSGSNAICTNTSDCSVRSLWKIIQNAVDDAIVSMTLADLLKPEDEIYGESNNLLAKLRVELKEL